MRRRRWAAHAPGLKSLDDAYAIRRRVLLAFEHAEREPDAEKRAVLLSFVVIGAGATGVVMIDWAWSYWTFERHARIVAAAATDVDVCRTGLDSVTYSQQETPPTPH